MIIYKDIVSGKELFSDSFKIETIDGIIYKVRGKMITENIGIDESKIGGNKSAEGGDDEQVADEAIKVIDVVKATELNNLGAYPKKSYLSALKKYMKKIAENQSQRSEEETKETQAKLNNFVKSTILANFKDIEFYTGEGYDATPDEGECMMIPCLWEEETPVFYFFKDGLEEEKC